MNETLIDLIRHGEPVGGRKYRGQLDDPLSERGWQQMREKLAGQSPWQSIISSPLSRCRAFAEELASRHRLALAFDERLKEVGFGVWEGKTAAQLIEEDPVQIERFRADPVSSRPAGAEPLQAFYQRVADAIEEVIERYRRQHVLIVCHAGVIRMALAHALNIPLVNAYRVEVASAALTRIAVDPEGNSRLVFHNGVPG
ncbi:MAG: alpha-ribazole phosphatase family protein [Thiobacillaceae bacterium]